MNVSESNDAEECFGASDEYTLPKIDCPVLTLLGGGFFKGLGDTVKNGNVIVISVSKHG